MLILSITVTFNVSCVTVFDYEIMPTKFYKVVHSQVWGLVVDFRVQLVGVNFYLQ